MSKKVEYILPNGNRASFNATKFKEALLNEKIRRSNAGEKCSGQKLMEEIADEIGTSFSSVKHWSLGHNAPVDFEKVNDLAKALHVDANFILTTNNMEEINEMKNMTTNVTIDYSSVKNTVRSIYINMSNYIEIYRMISSTDFESAGLKPLFSALYGTLMNARLDLPQKLFKELCSFAVNYLQQMGCIMKFAEYCEVDDTSYWEENIGTAEGYYEAYSMVHCCPYDAPWSDMLYINVNWMSKDGEAFRKAVIDEYLSYEEGQAIQNEIIIERAYSRLEEILSDFLMK